MVDVTIAIASCGRPELSRTLASLDAMTVPEGMSVEVVVADDDPEMFNALLHALQAKTARGAYDCCLLGLHEDDPLLPTARKHQVAEYVTRLYLVCWEDGEPLRAELDGRPSYLELGCL